MVKKYLVPDWNLEEEFQKQFKKLCRLPSVKKGFIEVIEVAEFKKEIEEKRNNLFKERKELIKNDKQIHVNAGKIIMCNYFLANLGSDDK